MKKFTLGALTAACMLSAGSALGQTAQPDEMAFRVKEEAFSHSRIEDIATFMTDRLGPRLAASRMKLRADSLVAIKLDSLGVGTPRREFAMKFAKGGWDNERNYVAMTAPYYCSYAANPKAWSGSTDGLVAGECVLLDAAEVADLAKYEGKLRGKIVLMPVRQTYELSFRPMATRYTEEQLRDMTQDRRPTSPWGSWSGRGGSGRQLQAAIDSLVARERPLAVIVGDGTFNVPGSRGVNYKVGDPAPVPQIVLPIEDHSRMVRLVKGGEKVAMELDVKNTFTDNQDINNLIVEIPGTDPKLKDEVVLIGAHLDSWHGGTGGADNASGCITMIEAMRILKALGVTPRRAMGRRGTGTLRLTRLCGASPV